MKQSGVKTIQTIMEQAMSKIRWVDVVQSVLASMIGVQSQQKREQDFQQNTVLPYVVVGLIAVALFVIGLVLIVSWIV